MKIFYSATLSLFLAPAIYASTKTENELAKRAAAAQELVPAAEAGDVEAAVKLGDYYRYDDWSRAVKWYFFAAQRSDVEKQYDICVKIDDAAFQQSRRDFAGGSENFLISEKCFQLGVDAGYAPAQNALGMLYEFGGKIPTNPDLGIKLYRQAARQGNSQAFQNLGAVYLSAPDSGNNLFIAYVYFLLAMKLAGDRQSSVEFSKYTSRDVVQLLSPAQKSEAKGISDAWRPGMPLLGLD